MGQPRAPRYPHAAACAAEAGPYEAGRELFGGIFCLDGYFVGKSEARFEGAWFGVRVGSCLWVCDSGEEVSLTHWGA